tara:strand:+ start:77 stop:988 length:912 start_codon:yes stop_codon:yes gene_type:complete
MLNRTIGITGCSGMLGRHLLDFFLKRKYELVGTSRTKVNIKNKRFKWKKIDLSLIKNESDYNKLFKNVFAIIHAGSAVPSNNIKITKNDYFRTNIRASKKLINFAKKNNIHLIFISGAIIYGNILKKVKENYKINNSKVLNYENSKRVIDLYLLRMINKYSCKFTILRPSSIYGKGLKDDKIIVRLINKVKQGKKIILKSPFEKINFIHANDVANAIFLCLIKKKYGVFNIGSKKLYSIKDIAKICNNFATKKVIIKVNKSRNKLMLKTRFNISINHAIKNLGWKPKISMSRGIRLIFKNKYC